MDEDHDAYRLLLKGQALMSEGMDRLAVVELQRASDLEPDKDSIRESLARALYNSGQTAKARDEFETLVGTGPTNHYAHFGLALCKARLGDRRGAIALLKIAVAMRPDMSDYQDALTKLAG